MYTCIPFLKLSNNLRMYVLQLQFITVFNCILEDLLSIHKSQIMIYQPIAMELHIYVSTSMRSSSLHRPAFVDALCQPRLMQ